VVICLERGADLHTAQRMPLPLTVSCLSKIQTGFTFLVLAHPGTRVVPDKGPLNVCVCVCNYLLCCHTLETTTFSSQSATVLVASLLLYIVFFDLNKSYVFLIASLKKNFTHVLVFILLFLSLPRHCSKVMICMYVCYVLLNKYSILNESEAAVCMREAGALTPTWTPAAGTWRRS